MLIHYTILTFRLTQAAAIWCLVTFHGSQHCYTSHDFDHIKSALYLFNQKSFSSSWRLWKIPRFRVSEVWPESGGSPFKVHGVFRCQDSSASEPFHERTLLDPLPHEEQCSATCLRTHSTSWDSELHSTAVPKYSGEWGFNNKSANSF